MSVQLREGRSFRRPLLGLLTLCLGSAQTLAGTQAQTAGNHRLDQAVMRVEIPAGSAVKYEFDQNGVLFVDRFLPGNEVYPANYGGLPGTLAGDGDPLDALVITRSPLLPGAHIRFRPLGVLYMRDGGARDEKLIGVPVDAVDADTAGLRDISDLPLSQRQRLAAFFAGYKLQPDGSNPVRIAGWGDAAQAQTLLQQAIAAASQPAD